MISKINIWAQGIIIAVIIGTIIQMILPENKNKKYIKVVIGIFILFSIIQPVIGNSINLNEYELDNYITANKTNASVSNKTDTTVNSLFRQKIITSINDKMKSMGYESKDIIVEYNKDYKITLIHISNITEYKEESDYKVNKIEISIKDKVATGISTSQKKDLMEYLEKNYDIKQEYIEID